MKRNAHMCYSDLPLSTVIHLPSHQLDTDCGTTLVISIWPGRSVFQ